MKEEIMLAVDPFEPAAVSLKNAVGTIKQFAKQSGASVIATTVVSPDRVKWPTDLDEAWLAHFEKVGRIETKKLLKTSGGSEIDTVVLNQPYNSSADTIQTLVDYSNTEKVKALAVFTHERLHPKFSFSGSFSCRLINKSKVPVLAIDVRGKKIDQVKRIVISTTFASRESKALNASIEWAKKYDAELVFLTISITLAPGFPQDSTMVGGIERLNAFLEKQKTQATVDCEKWVRKARQGGARARYLIESSSMGVSEVILRATKKLDADLIIMTAVTGPKQAFFLGSVTNDILRRAKRPVLVFN